MKNKCEPNGGISHIEITQAVNLTFGKPTKPYWEVMGYKSEDDLINATHLHIMTKDGYFCMTCNTDLNSCALRKKQ